MFLARPKVAWSRSRSRTIGRGGFGRPPGFWTLPFLSPRSRERLSSGRRRFQGTNFSVTTRLLLFHRPGAQTHTRHRSGITGVGGGGGVDGRPPPSVIHDDILCVCLVVIRMIRILRGSCVIFCETRFTQLLRNATSAILYV